MDVLASAVREEEDRPDNFFVLPPNNNQVWQDVCWQNQQMPTPT